MFRILLLGLLFGGSLLGGTKSHAQAEPTPAAREDAARREADLQAKREALDAERRRLLAEIKDVETNLQRLRALRASRQQPSSAAEREAAERTNREEDQALQKLERGRAELAQKMKEIETQLMAIAAPLPPDGPKVPRRVSSDERFLQRLAEYRRSIEKLRTDGNEQAAQRVEEEASDYARQHADRTRIELEVMRNHADQLRSSGRDNEARQLEQAIAGRNAALAAAEQARAETRSPQDGPGRARPMTNVDSLSRDAIVRRISHFKQAQTHLQEVGRGEIVEQLQREIDRLENRLAALDAPPLPAGPELVRLQTENEQLKKDVAALKEAVDRLTEALKQRAAPPRMP